MIGIIRGTLIAKQPPDVVVDVAGVGYEIQVPMTTLFDLPGLGEEVTLLTHFVVREDAQLLYGFLAQEERRLFRELIKVSGVGPKLALALLSGMDARAFSQCLQRDDVSALVALPGVGRKTAERLLVEMRDKAGKWLEELAPVAANPQVAVAAVSVDFRAEAEQALVALGYKLPEAARLVSSVESDEGESSEELIRRALKAAAPRATR
ncbi:MAG: Holliday junction branch migration protein RuvA [Luminiphilus sp.]|jgi:Holliday junction DNA helicase RuvA|nr:Holliday junction branch migration protein RuvA [Luminiphilus sp.]MDA0630110.1 Holliday junction branch migration protein RuvA [Pseudomonadota bacterium]